MNKRYQQLHLALVAALLFAGFSPLQADPTADEKKTLKAAQQSFKDGAFDLCADRIAALLKKYPKSELTAEAELLQARALYHLGRSDSAVAALNLPIDQVPENLRADTLFWQAESLLDLGRWPDAEQKYRALLALKNPADHGDAANLGLAWALFKQGKEADAQALIQVLTKDKSKTAAGQQAQLLQAKIQLAKKQFKEAATTLEALLATKPENKLAFEANYWLGETYSQNGQPDKAVVAYQKITSDSRAFPKALVAQANLGLGRAQHALNQNDLAAAAYEQAYTLSDNQNEQLAAFRAYLESARAANQLPEAVTKLQEFARKSVSSAPAALFAIGSALADDKADDKAIGILESLLVAYGSSPWIPAANGKLGQLYARTGKFDQAIKALQSCIDTSPDPDLVRTARFQLGGVLYQTKDYAGAAAQFAQVSDGTDAENAAYNFLLAQASLGKNDVFAKAEADFQKRFPKSPHLKAIALAEGQLLLRLNKTDDAKAAFQRGIALEGGGPDQKALLKALDDLQYQTGDLDGTYATCQLIVAQFPDDSLDAAMRGILVSYEQKKINDDQVEQFLTALAQKYNKSPGAAEVYFRLGEFYFYRQDYVKAQDAFQQLTAAFPASSYTDNAYFFAGRAAAAHQDYTAALALLDKVPDNSPFKPDARLWQGRVAHEQLNFAQAITLYDSVLATEKTGPRFVEANLLKGKCLFDLASQSKDPANYTQAIAAFDQILKSKEGTIAELNEAAVSSAKCLEKLGKTSEAMNLYLDVLYGRVAGDDSTSTPAPDFSWQIKAGWEAGRIREEKKDWRGAIEIYRRLEQIGGAHQQEFHDNINRLRRDNYIYE